MQYTARPASLERRNHKNTLVFNAVCGSLGGQVENPATEFACSIGSFAKKLKVWQKLKGSRGWWLVVGQ